MKAHALAAAAALALALPVAHAQAVIGLGAPAAGSQSQSGSQSAAGANSGAVSSNATTLVIEASQPLPAVENRQTHSGGYSIRSAPPVTVTGPASGPCTGVSGGFGASWMGGGLGINGASVDRNCSLRENARIMAMIIPTLSGDDQAELRKMLMATLTTIYAEFVMGDKPAPKVADLLPPPGPTSVAATAQ